MDKKLLTELYYQFQESTIKILSGYGIDYSDAEDYYHELLISLLKKEADRLNVGNLQAYITTAAHNKGKTHCRRQKRIKEIMDSYGTFLSIDIREEGELEEREVLFSKLDTAVPKLARRRKQIIRLFLEGDSHSAISQKLGITYKAVCNNMSLAHKQLKRILKIKKRNFPDDNMSN